MIVRFQFEATDDHGQTRSGEVEASNWAEARDQVQARGWTVLTIEAALDRDLSNQALSERDVIELLTQLQTLTRAGLSLPAGLRAASGEVESSALRATCLDLARRLDTGQGLDAVLLAQANRFPAHLQGLVRAGDRSGRLADVLGEVVQGSNLGVELRRKVWATLAYPTVALAVILALTSFICRTSAIVLDEFVIKQELFNVATPAIIVSVFALTKFFAANDVWLVLGAGGFALVAWLVWVRLVSAVQRRRTIKALPLIGPLDRDVGLAEFCHLTALLVEAATPLPEALRLAGASVQDAALAEDSARVAAAVELGEPFSVALRTWIGLPAGLGQLLTWGEGQQNLAGSLRFAGDLFEERAEAQAAFANQVLTSSLLLLIICWVGFAIASIYLPITYSIQLLGKLAGVIVLF